MLAVAGCAMGPDFSGGITPGDRAYTSVPLPARTESSSTAMGSAQYFREGVDIPYEWWLLFRSKDLDFLINLALAENPSLKGAEAAIRAAQENVNAATGSQYYPDLALDIGSSRQKVSPAAAGMPDGKGHVFSLHHAGLGISYVFDIFGRGRRGIEALKAGVDHEWFRLQAAHLTISAQVVRVAVREAELRMEIRLTEKIAALQARKLELLKQQLALGSISRADLTDARAQLESTRALLPAYENALSRLRHQLTSLTGKLPDESLTLPQFDLSSFELPTDLPVSLSSDLVRQRPDIRAAEALLHAATALEGVAEADLYPQIMLSGSYGPQAGEWENLFKGESLVWGIAGGIVQPVFNGGALRAKQRRAAAATGQATAYFRETVIRAFQDVADALRAITDDALVLKAQAEVVDAAEEALTLAQQKNEAGATGYLEVLQAEEMSHRARIGVVRAQASRLLDTVMLFQALGGGWHDHRSF
jgi:NodT family efflux transporter outer membrane factor (OMF) lipoprotein